MQLFFCLYICLQLLQFLVSQISTPCFLNCLHLSKNCCVLPFKWTQSLQKGFNSLRCIDPYDSYIKTWNKNKLISAWNCFSPLYCKYSDKMWMYYMTLKSMPQHIKFKCSFPHSSCADQVSHILSFFRESNSSKDYWGLIKYLQVFIYPLWNWRHCLEWLYIYNELITGTVKMSLKKERMLLNISNKDKMWLHTMTEVTLRIQNWYIAKMCPRRVIMLLNEVSH